MKIKKFRTSSATIDYIIADFTLNRIADKNVCFMKCVGERINRLNDEYNEKVDKILNFIIMRCNYSDLPIEILSRVIYSLSKITNAMSKGILSIIKGK